MTIVSNESRHNNRESFDVSSTVHVGVSPEHLHTIGAHEEAVRFIGVLALDLGNVTSQPGITNEQLEKQTARTRNNMMITAKSALAVEHNTEHPDVPTIVPGFKKPKIIRNNETLSVHLNAATADELEEFVTYALDESLLYQMQEENENLDKMWLGRDTYLAYAESLAASAPEAPIEALSVHHESLVRRMASKAISATQSVMIHTRELLLSK